VIHQDGAPLPTWRERCTAESTEVVAVVEGGKAYTVEYRSDPGPLSYWGTIAPELSDGLTLTVNATRFGTVEPVTVALVNPTDETKCTVKVSDAWDRVLMGAPLRVFTTTYAGLPMVEVALSWINGDTLRPQGAKLVDRFEIVAPPGWAVVSMTPSDRNAKGGTLEQGRRRDMRVVIVPEAMRSAAERWVEAGAGRALAVDHLGRIVTPHPTGLRWTKPGDAVTQQARQRATAVTVAAFGRSKFPELLAYGTSTEIPSGWQDAIGQPYGGKTGGQEFAPLTRDASALPWTVFAYFETLRVGVADRCLYLTTGGDPVSFDAGLGFAIDMNTGARLFATKGTHPLRAKFVEAVDDPGTVRNSHGSIDWQHGSARFGPAEIMATLWNDPLAKYGLALDAAMARLETTPAEVKAKGGALGRAEAWMAHANALDVMFNESVDAAAWLRAFVAGVGDGTSIAVFAGGHKEVKYGRAFAAWRDYPADVAALAGTSDVKKLFASHVDKMTAVADARAIPHAPVSQPWQRYALAHGLRMAWRSGALIDDEPAAAGLAYRTILFTTLFVWRDADGLVPYRVFLDGTRASDDSDGMHLRWALGMLAESCRDVGLAWIGLDSLRALSHVNGSPGAIAAHFAKSENAPNAELLLGVIS
jgi:hypothetical protein